jgi:hypothetical protein
MERILGALARDGDMATGKLHREVFGEGGLDRKSFEHVLGGLARAGLVEVRDASFQKDGERIDFQRVSLTDRGWDRGDGTLDEVPVYEAPQPKKRRKKASEGKGKKGAVVPQKSADEAKKDAARRAFFAKRARRRKGGRG